MARARWKNWSEAVIRTTLGGHRRRRSWRRRGNFALVQDRDAVLSRVAHAADLRILIRRVHPAAVLRPPHEPEIHHHLMILLRLAAVGGQIVADHGAVRA